MLKSWLNGCEESDSICCQPLPRIFRSCHRHGNLLSTVQTELTAKANTADPAVGGVLVPSHRFVAGLMCVG
jgi:hypothetical protein